MTRLGAGGVLLASLTLLAGCGGSGVGVRGQGPGAPVSTPMSSLSPGVASTIALLQAAVATTGRRLDPPQTAYRPSEPATLADTPRAVLKASTADPSQGYVVIYQLPDAATAAARAKDMASHVGSGFGQTNFPADARFHVASVGDTVVFTWWSPEAASDDEATAAVYEAVASVGVESPVVK